MHAEPDSYGPTLTGHHLEVTLDGRAVPLPPQRRTLAAVRAYLEILALEQQRILAAFKVDGQQVSLSGVLLGDESFARVEAETIDLDQVPLQLVRTALQQAHRVRNHAQAAVTLVLINNSAEAREIWWELAQELKKPLLTLSLMPEAACLPAEGSASLLQLRRWQLEQLGVLIKGVDEAGAGEDTISLSTAIEERVMAWLGGLLATLDLWQATLLVGHSST